MCSVYDDFVGQCISVGCRMCRLRDYRNLKADRHGAYHANFDRKLQRRRMEAWNADTLSKADMVFHIVI